MRVEIDRQIYQNTQLNIWYGIFTFDDLCCNVCNAKIERQSKQCPAIEAINSWLESPQKAMTKN